ncbi:hypothetical protein GGR57DRAFT_475291 [Xylariaceae sp. FL1272]|nr:hypothetical protein GGR57DRAFT_475291 [Xylariaceae sp. FL1272]
MPSVQNTFSVIPDVPSAINGHAGPGGPQSRMGKPPMTTKQVKKAYQKANKGPKLSKAEQRRQELFEQDRIRKEFEKERNQARARAARDKKKDKEERERAEKKKKGLPLVNVRPSQDTIAWFVRGKPKHQAQDERDTPSGSKGDQRELEGEDGDEDDAQSEQSEHSLGPEAHWSEPPYKKPRLDIMDKENIPLADIPRDSPASSPVRDDEGLVGFSKPSSGTPLPSNEMPMVQVKPAEDKLPATVANGVDPVTPDLDSVTAVDDDPEEPKAFTDQQKALNKSESFSSVDFDEQGVLEEVVRAESVHKRLQSEGRRKPEDRQHASPPAVPPPRKPPEDFLSPARLENKHLSRNSDSPASSMMPPPIPSSRSFRHPKTPMGPPAPKFRPSKPTSTGQHTRPQFVKSPFPITKPAPAFLPRHAAISDQLGQDKLPSSTQLFMMNNLDDFLPSPSQEMREIFEEPKLPNPTKRDNSFPTQRNRSALNSSVTSEQGGRYVKSNRLPERSNPTQNIRNEMKHPKATGITAMPPPRSNHSFDFDTSFLSTQDVFLSSQDMKDIGEEPLSPVKAPVTAPAALNVRPAKENKPLFTSTSREISYKYASERSKTAAWESPKAQRKRRRELSEIQALEDQRLKELLAETHEDLHQPHSVGASITSESPRQSPLEHNRPFSKSSNEGNHCSIPCSPPLPKASLPGNARKPPNAQKQNTQKQSQNQTNTGPPRRPSKPKSSFEEMCEAIGKPNRQKSLPKPVNLRNQSSDIASGSSDKENTRYTKNDKHAASEGQSEEPLFIPGTQETDYDDDEWNDNELRDALYFMD